MTADVRIISDDSLNSLPPCLAISRHHRDRSKMVALSSVAPFVWRMYDPVILMGKIESLLPQLLDKNPESQTNRPYSRDPLLFSFWVAQNLPLDDAERQQLLECPSTPDRLQKELRLLQNILPISCKRCRETISSWADIFSMSEEGSVGTFVNPHGYIHQMVTLRKTRNIRLVGYPCTEDSWFPGYAWTIANCRCGCHLGWRFTAVEDSLLPRAFWGLRRNMLLNAKD
jgi:cereblon